jgi:AcrR family transcriptional regulator
MSPPAATPTRDRIIREATRLFAAQGIKATTVAQIETAVGLRPGSGGVHRHFVTKDELIRAVLDAQLQTGRDAQAAATAWPKPTPDQIPSHLEALGRFILEQANQSREVALIMLRDAHNLPPGLLDQHHLENFELVYTTMANAVRELQQTQGADTDIDADALAFLFMAPLIYFRLIEWAHDRRILDLDDDRLLDTWTKLFIPVFTSLSAPR